MLWKFIILSLISLCLAHLAFLGGRNLIILILIVETLFLCLSLAFIVYHYEHAAELPNNDSLFFGYALIVLSASESAVLLALLARVHRKCGSILIREPDDDNEKPISK